MFGTIIGFIMGIFFGRDENGGVIPGIKMWGRYGIYCCDNKIYSLHDDRSRTTIKLNDNYGIYYNGNERVLQTMVLCRNLAAVTTLLERGTDVNFNDTRALQLAAINNDAPMIRKLFEFGADVRTVGCNTFMWCAYDGKLEIVDIFFKNGVTMNDGVGRSLAFSIENNNLKMTELLLENGADIHYNNESIFRHLSANFNERMADIVLQYCGANDCIDFPTDYLKKIKQIKSANKS